MKQKIRWLAAGHHTGTTVSQAVSGSSATCPGMEIRQSSSGGGKRDRHRAAPRALVTI
jgi:hypothetical protein